jgi:hypothetical protein
MIAKLIRPVLAFLLFGTPASAGLVNVDINVPGGATHAGSDGALSTSGAFWNGVRCDTDQGALRDESGTATPIGLVYLRTRTPGPFLDFASFNNLQDDGMTGEGFDIRGLDPNTRYTLAVYSTLGASFNLLDAGGNHGGSCSSASPTYLLPGLEGRDYCRFENLVPYEVVPGSYGIRVSGLQGAITGFEILGTPAPDVTAPQCSGNVLAGTPGSVEIHVQDTESGLASIQITQRENAAGDPPAFSTGTRDAMVFTVTQVDPYQVTRVEVTSLDVAGNSSTCNFEIPAGTPPPPPDVTPPSCSGNPTAGPPAAVTVSLQDTESGLASVTATQTSNASVDIPSFVSGSLEVLVVTLTQVDPYQPTRVELTSTDVAGNPGTCVYEIAAATPPPPLDAEPPLCSGTVLAGPPASLDISVQDLGSGLASITVVSGDNAHASIPSFPSGTTGAVHVTVTKTDPTLLARIEIASGDVAGNTATCRFEIPADAATTAPCQDLESCCAEMLSFYHAVRAQGGLSGNGPGNSGNAHRGVFERQLDHICDLIGSGEFSSACTELGSALKKVDGQPAPVDFVVGPMAPQMAQRIRDLQSRLACTAVTAPTRTLTTTSSETPAPVTWGLLKAFYDTSP